MLPLKDKVALITGSSRGIGNAIARKLALAGADIVVNFRKAGGSSQEQAEQLCREVEGMGRRALMVQADIAVKDSVKKLFAEVNEKFGRLDILILNAAKAPFKPIEKLFERELRQLVETNYLGNIFCIQEALPLLERSGGKIVFISSLGSRFYNPAYPLGSMKAAMESVVRDCAEGLRQKNISVNAVCGGIVKTDSFKVLRQFWENIDMLPESLFVEPDELADVVVFLCGKESRGITGQTIVVDKGLSNAICRLPESK
ncbi:MAG: SDR family oxidoreductase [Nitrospirae bacterium]|nr:SDR family oxidoreductase [Nitrospirota bacterium]